MQTARGNGVNKLFTSKDLTPAQRRLRWVIIGIWVILAYGAVCVLVGSAPWTIWRLYGGLAALGGAAPGSRVLVPGCLGAGSGRGARSRRPRVPRGPGPAVPPVPSTPVAVVLQH